VGKKRDNQQGLLRIISGGQTGVDRAALDVAFALGLPHGGFCPLGRRAEDGPIPDHYPLVELASEDYAVRTERNVLESDGTIILYRYRLSGGTLLTFQLARRHQKSYRLVRLDRTPSISDALAWLHSRDIQTLNVAGPRASSDPEIYELAATFLWELLQDFPRIRLSTTNETD